MATFILLELLARRHLRRERVFGIRCNPKDYSEEYFLQNYNFPKPLFFKLCDVLRRDLARKTMRSQALSVELQVLWALRFLTTGSFQEAATNNECHQATMSKNINNVVNILNEKVAQYINFPQNLDSLTKVKSKFHADYNFPNAIGVVGGLHVRIRQPSIPDSHVYLNEKKQYSIKVQVVCDADLQILDIVARWPGSVESSRIWETSGLRNQLMSGAVPQPSYLLGSNEYPLEPWLLTPLENPNNTPQNDYNSFHHKARQCVERCFLAITSRFCCINHSKRTLLYHPEKVCKIFMAVCVLHNFLLKHGYGQTLSEEKITSAGKLVDDIQPTVSSELQNAGHLVREELILSNFT